MSQDVRDTIYLTFAYLLNAITWGVLSFALSSWWLLLSVPLIVISLLGAVAQINHLYWLRKRESEGAILTTTKKDIE